MLDAVDPLATLAALETRYDGLVPEGSLVLARLGSAAVIERLYAEGQAAFFRHLVVDQIRLIRRRRRDGSAYPELLTDLALYRRHWRHWRSTLRTLRAAQAGARLAPAVSPSLFVAATRWPDSVARQTSGSPRPLQGGEGQGEGAPLRTTPTSPRPPSAHAR